jgi:Sulfotransferase family
MAVARSARPRPDGAPVTRDRPAGGSGPDAGVGGPPVIVLASAYCGAGRLSSLLAGHPDLACTSGTGVLPLCEQAMATWRKVDDQAGRPPSLLAVAATRALAASIITSLLAREGKPRWCEVAAASSQAAETFLRIYPGTRFLCMYRACPGVIRAALDASPWGLADPGFAPFTRAYPASTVAALTAYWVAHTGSLLDFEHSHPQACLRVRFEDLAGAEHHKTAAEIESFLGLVDLQGQPSPGEVHPTQSAPDSSDPEVDLPVDLIPAVMLAQANDLLRHLDYRPLPATRPTDKSAARAVRGRFSTALP